MRPRPTPRLERRNAQRYEVDRDDSDSDSNAISADRRAHSLDVLSSFASRSSFRLHGVSKYEVDDICRNLGLAGPEDFAIPAAAWEARKSRSSSDRLPPSRLLILDADTDDEEEASPHGGTIGEPRPPPIEPNVTIENDREERSGDGEMAENGGGVSSIESSNVEAKGNTEEEIPGGTIRGPRPPPIEPPVSVEKDRLERSNDGNLVENGGGVSSVESSDVETNGDDSSSLATEGETSVSPGVMAERTIRDWILGKELGRGSFGTVYEAMNHDGFFFAVKEVSLLDQGSNAQQCIDQLEHEISLLSHFEHENIVRYLGTEKQEAKLFIFLELVTQGSLASLYQKYQLRDSQVSSYTRQILHGLKYLHDKKVVHRDIKCANILVDANGSVKLADFGLAKEASKFTLLKSSKGSAYWMAPEVVNPKGCHGYGSAADIWSLGCTVLEMLTRKLPYPHLEWMQALFKIGRGEKPEIPEYLSSDARDFICLCVQVNPNDRPDAGKLLDHPFVRRQYSNGAALGLDFSSHGRRV